MMSKKLPFAFKAVVIFFLFFLFLNFEKKIPNYSSIAVLGMNIEWEVTM